MEAASATGSLLLTRDGAIPASPSLHPGSRAGDRQPIDGVVSCSCCERFPLVGERITRHEGKRGGWACESCERDGKGRKLGPIAERDRIRSLGGAMNVRRAA